jgi:hypothetical protein
VLKKVGVVLSQHFCAEGISSSLLFDCKIKEKLPHALEASVFVSAQKLKHQLMSGFFSNFLISVKLT